MNARFVPPGIDQLRERALRQAVEWTSNANDLRVNMTLNAWRDNCRDEIRDELADEKLSSAEADLHLGAWSNAFDCATLNVKVSVNGFAPVDKGDIADTADMTHPQIETLGALFRVIARLSSDDDILRLCEHGALQADLAANTIDVLRERALNAGVVGGPL